MASPMASFVFTVGKPSMMDGNRKMKVGVNNTDASIAKVQTVMQMQIDTTIKNIRSNYSKPKIMVGPPLPSSN
jgi:hypothetical protein